MATPNKPEPSQRPPKPRFSWPLRIFLILFMYDMFTRGLIRLTPAAGSWVDDHAIASSPLALPSPEALRRADAGEDPDHGSATQRWMASIKSLGRFFVPVPTEQTRETIDSPLDTAKYVVTWLGSRQDFIGKMVGVDQSWPMFSPDVGDDDTVGRLTLIYDDGSRVEHHLIHDPEDLTRYSHWFQEKHLQTAYKVHRDPDVRLGYCMMLAKREARNEAGARLERIQIHKVTYEYPPPGADAKAWLAAQTDTPAEQIEPPFWEYDVATVRGRKLEPPAEDD